MAAKRLQLPIRNRMHFSPRASKTNVEAVVAIDVVVVVADAAAKVANFRLMAKPAVTMQRLQARR